VVLPLGILLDSTETELHSERGWITR